MKPGSKENCEVNDVDNVEKATVALRNGNLDLAETILLSVITNTPEGYSNITYNSDNSLTIRFWDQQSFVHYIGWMKKEGKKHSSIKWPGNAYPLAYYLLASISVDKKDYDGAIVYINNGLSLEPTNPKFLLEKAVALLYIGEKQKALSLYESIDKIDPFVSAIDMAVATRGRGSVLIEMGQLDKAEEQYKKSLELEPNNEIALHELECIKSLREETGTLKLQSPSMDPPPSPFVCAWCGNKEAELLTVVNVDDSHISVCQNCMAEIPEK